MKLINFLNRKSNLEVSCLQSNDVPLRRNSLKKGFPANKDINVTIPMFLYEISREYLIFVNIK